MFGNEKKIMTEKEYEEQKERKKVLYENLPLELSQEDYEKLFPSKYEFIKDKLNRVYVIVHVYKGISMAQMEEWTTNKLRMIRLYIAYDDTKAINEILNLADVFVKSEIENVDIQLDIFLTVLRSIYTDIYAVNNLIKDMLDRYDVVSEGMKIGEIRMGYDEFVKLVNMLREIMMSAYDRYGES